MNSNLNRRSGILIHPTALPGKYGIGEIGPQAYNFIDNLVAMGQSLWQILPIGPTDIYNSPYSSISTFAGNPLIISLDLLIEDGLLDSNLLTSYKQSNSNKILFSDVVSFKIPILEKVSREFEFNASSNMKNMFDEFCKDNSYWLDDYSNYCALKIKNEYTPWMDWESEIIKDYQHAHEIKIIQFIFHDQWNRLRQYCKNCGIQIIGDMPLYVGHDSSDVYANRELFQLDSYGKMTSQSGCPPCEYQEEGQLWGTPLYNWNEHKQNDFQWWNKRFKKLFEMVDIIRLDHFIGYIKYYSIPINDKTAHNGDWFEAPGYELFDNLSSTFPNFNVIAEDLGDVTVDVINLRQKFKFPGMSVLQFEIEDIINNKYSPNNSIVCTGTHDNDTLLGWIHSLSDNDEKAHMLSRLLELFNCSIEDIHWEIINYAFNTSSNKVIIPIQDILKKSSASRFNTPGTLSLDNWSWIMDEDDLTQSIKNKVLNLTMNSSRNINMLNSK